MQSDSKEKILKLEKIFSIKTKDKKLFERALRHSSYTKENELNSLENYERLELLGDAVLKLCMSDILYKKFPEYSEGQLTKIRSIIVSDKTLAQAAFDIGLDKLVILGKQEEKSGGRKLKSIIACAFEAVLGAYYLEGKFTKLSEFLANVFESKIVEVDENGEKFNAKAVLQEYTQAQSKSTPKYFVVDEVGPQHDKTFVVEVCYQDEILATGKGKTKREAEQAAAYAACVNVGAIDK